MGFCIWAPRRIWCPDRNREHRTKKNVLCSRAKLYKGRHGPFPPASSQICCDNHSFSSLFSKCILNKCAKSVLGSLSSWQLSRKLIYSPLRLWFEGLCAEIIGIPALDKNECESYDVLLPLTQLKCLHLSSLNTINSQGSGPLLAQPPEMAGHSHNFSNSKHPLKEDKFLVLGGLWEGLFDRCNQGC